MICPNCKCEYIRGVTHCADCDMPLVEALDLQDTSPEGDVRIVAAWRGGDPTECESVQEALEQAGIACTVPDSKGSFSFIPTERALEIWIAAVDLDRAKKIIFDLQERVDPAGLTPEEIESLALAESDQLDHDTQTSQPQNLPENWFEDEPVAEIWNGQNESLANDLIACLREIGIASHKLSADDNWRLVVLPEQESRAKEIVREVVDASPPE
jgi:hypothetical protein